MVRLRRVSSAAPGWTRVRAGRGFRYLDEHHRPLLPDQIVRVRALAIPPAWRDVWICPVTNGHLQATGTDAAGRRRYLYHPAWRELRDRQKFERVAQAAARLPQVRERVAEDLSLAGLPLARATAAAVRMLDLGAFRIGNDYYTDENGSYGLTTLERRHVRRHGDALRFAFVGKSGIEHLVEVADPDVVAAIEAMRRRGRGARLLGYVDAGAWVELGAPAVNRYLAELFGSDFTAKDFRTWQAGVVAAESLALSPEGARTAASCSRALRAAFAAVAEQLGNTVAVAKASYVDPRIIDRFHAGVTIAAAAGRSYPDPDARRAGLEAALRDLLSDGG